MLGVLVEKQHTVPDTYPLTLNALVAGCNQKTSRHPVIEASDGEVQEALDRLKGLDLVNETSGGRAMRYAHNLGKVLSVPPQSVAILAALFLRGAQTAGELRVNTDRVHRFGDILAVEGFLRELAEAALVRELPRAPGARETRWMHLLSGEPAASDMARPSAEEPPPHDELAILKATVESLRQQVAELRQAVAALGERAES